MTASAVVFAYHDVGVRCLSVLLAHGLNIPLVVTHEDVPGENIWFESVEALARLHDIPVVKPDDPNVEAFIARVHGLRPEFIFSFYYRCMLKPALLAAAQLGALNMHGSLLPRYRGRAPVNWSVINGERTTGASLHRMVAKPDAGALVAQQAVPILPDDSALDVFRKVTVAAELALNDVLPALLAGTAPQLPQRLEEGSYFGGRRPEDGRIDWNRDAAAVHNLIRGVAPPYPGAFTELRGQRLRILRTRHDSSQAGGYARPTLFVSGERCYAQCGNGAVLRLIELECHGRRLDASGVSALLGGSAFPLPIEASS